MAKNHILLCLLKVVQISFFLPIYVLTPERVSYIQAMNGWLKTTFSVCLLKVVQVSFFLLFGDKHKQCSYIFGKNDYEYKLVVVSCQQQLRGSCVATTTQDSTRDVEE